MSASTIYNQLCLCGMSPVGACAMLGNMMAESGLQSNIAQRGMTGMSDEAYTRAADNGTIGFSTDAVGYGLCQWTYCTRKAGLLSFAKQRGRSVGDEDTQVRYCIKELQDDFNALWQYLRKTDDIDEATDRICAEFERPAVNNFMTRRDHAKRYYNEFVSGAFNPIASTVPSTADKPSATGDKPPAVDSDILRSMEQIIQVALAALGYKAFDDYDTAVVNYAEDIAAGRWG